MIIKTCVDCGAVILSNNVTARRCPVCAERFAERVRKKYKNPPADPLTADVRKADAAGKSYGYWRLDELLKEQKAREELDNLIERNRKRKEHGSISKIRQSAMTRRCCGLLPCLPVRAAAPALRLASTSLRQRPVSARLGGAAT